MKKLRHRFGFKLFLVVFVLLFLSLGVIGTINIIMLYNQASHKLNENLEFSRDNAHLLVDTAIKLSIENYLLASADGLKNSAQKFYDDYKKGLITQDQAKENFGEIVLSSKIGNSGYPYVCRTDFAPDSIPRVIHPQGYKEISDQDFMQSGVKEKSGTQYYLWKDSGEEKEKWKVVAFSYFEPWDYLIGVSIHMDEIACIVDKSLLSNNLAAFKVGGGSSDYLSVINSDGRVIIHPVEDIVGKNVINKKDQNGQFIFKNLLESGDESYIRYLWKDPNTNYVDWKRVYPKKSEITGWSVALTTSEEEINKPIFSSIIIIVIAMILLYIVASVVIFMFSKLVSKPLIKITDLLDDMSKGSAVANKNLYEKRKDEFGDLSRSFNTTSKFLLERNTVINNISKGWINVEVPLASKKDYTGKSINRMVESLRSFADDIHTAVDQIKTGSSQISESSQVLSDGASVQSSSIEEISASMNDVSTQISRSAEHSKDMETMSSEMYNLASDGNNKMRQLIEFRENINKSAHEIENIVKVIDDIAFQTNLLALNADIEAARVGKYGKGFAVVANSVRTLSEKSQVSVKETKKRVDEVVDCMNKGNEMIRETAVGFEKITNTSEKVKELAKNISIMSQEQNNSIDMVRLGLNQIEDVVQSNSANAEENAASSEELATQSIKLQELVSFFKYGRPPLTLEHSEEYLEEANEFKTKKITGIMKDVV